MGAAQLRALAHPLRLQLLDVLGAEAGEHDLALIRLAIAPAVAIVQQG